MDGAVQLYGELCGVANIKDKERIWKILNKYQIKQLLGFKSFDECFDEYIKAKICDGLSDRTIQNYKTGVRKFKKFINNKLPALIESTDIRNYITWMKDERKLKRTTINQNTVIVKVFFGWLYSEDMIIDNPTKHIKPLKEDYEPRTPLTTRELNRIKKACKSKRDIALVNFFANTGCRVSEVTGLTLKDIDIDKHWAVVTGKGDKKRTVLFNEATAQSLREWLESKPESEYLFSNVRNNSPISNSNVEAIIRRLGKVAKIKKGMYPHRLRHTFASNALSKGMDLVCIQTLLGHESLTTTQIYAKINQNNLRKQYKKVFED